MKYVGRVRERRQGERLGNENIDVLLFADDMLAVITNSPTSLSRCNSTKPRVGPLW